MKKQILFFIALFYLFVQAMPAFMGGTIDIDNLHNYEDQEIPSYVRNDLSPSNNQLTDEIATLGRVLFYDKKLSLNGTISCASCHKQEFGFGDTSIVSKGFDGSLTERHSMRLININYGETPEVFWDARGKTLEDQPAITLANSIEMGFSGEQGQPDIDSLIRRLEKVPYYEKLFEFVYGDRNITIGRMEKAISQFVRSITSFDSKFDEGLAQGGDILFGFPNYTELEDRGRFWFFTPFDRARDPLTEEIPDSVHHFGCHSCHDFPNISQTNRFPGNNGVTGVAGDSLARDYSIVRTPSLRNMFTHDGQEIGPFMHDGSLKDLNAVLDHYALIKYDEENDKIAEILNAVSPSDTHRPMSEYQKKAVIAFLKTLTGNDVFANPKWSDPFDSDGNIEVVSQLSAVTEKEVGTLRVYPNPATTTVRIQSEHPINSIEIYDAGGRLVDHRSYILGEVYVEINVSQLMSGVYVFKCHSDKTIAIKKVVIE